MNPELFFVRPENLDNILAQSHVIELQQLQHLIDFNTHYHSHDYEPDNDLD
jgi:hypothetical protein